jgi:hypothetical protein
MNDILDSRGETDYFLSAAVITEFGTKQSAYVAAVSAMQTARAAGTRSESLTAARTTARDALLVEARQIYATVAKNPAISDQNKIDLGVHVGAGRSPIGVPNAAPKVTVAEVVGTTISIRVFDPLSRSKRAKLPTATQAWLYTFVGEEYPSDPGAWTFHGATTTYKHTIELPTSLPGGTQVWVMAAWVNPRGQSGPPSMPVSAFTQYTGKTTVEAAGTQGGDLKIAA